MKTGRQKVNDAYKSIKVLITGHRGYVGSVLYKELAKLECEVKAFEGDISDKAAWEKNLDGVDLIFHLAAIEYNSTKDPYEDLSINAISMLNLLEACRSNKSKPRVVFASSSNIFSKTKNLPATEEEKDTPMSIWSSHKLLAENYLNILSDQLGTTTCSLRLSNVYGPSTTVELSKRMSLNKMINMAVTNGNFKLFNNASCIRDWVYVNDVVDAFIYAGTINDNESHNFLIGTSYGGTILDTAATIVDEVERVLDRAVKVDYITDVQLPSMAMRDYFPDCSLFKTVTGWKPKHSIVEGIRMTVKYFGEQNES